jgi:hypothetical protein
VKCDCLNECGDDPWLKTGQAEVCDRRAKHLRAEKEHRENIEYLARYVQRSRDRELAAAIAKLLLHIGEV